MEFNIRAAELEVDVPFLWEMLYQSLHVPDGVEPFSRDILKQPHLVKYLEGWGRKSDIGLIAEQSDGPVGATWLRLFDASNPGYGYVDDATPEIGIAVIPPYRGYGIGAAPMTPFFKIIFA